MPELIFHPKTKAKLESLAKSPSHAVLIEGPRGSGKGSTLQLMSAAILGIPKEKLTDYPYILRITPDKTGSILIDQVREIDRFLNKKVPGQGLIRRVVLIEDSDKMTLEAQNAVLKNIEETPLDTAILLSASRAMNLIPTLRSRLVSIALIKPDTDELAAHLKKINQEDDVTRQALNISGGWPGLASSLALADSDHPLVKAAAVAREILSSDRYHRLLKAQELYKDIDLIKDTLSILMQMAFISLQKSGPKQARSWQNILSLAYETEELLDKNVNTRLALTHFLINL